MRACRALAYIKSQVGERKGDREKRDSLCVLTWESVQLLRHTSDRRKRILTRSLAQKKSDRVNEDKGNVVLSIIYQTQVVQTQPEIIH